jgi:hypothetical protein
MKIINPAFLTQVLAQHIDNDYEIRKLKHQAIMFARSSNPITTNPLNLLACGDSWFDYPLDGHLYGPHTDVLAQVKDVSTIAPEIYSLAHFGYTSTQEIGFQRQQMLVEALQDDKNGKFDAILMSGGGNDIAGDALVVWLNDARTVSGRIDLALNKDRLFGALSSIKASYLDLIAIRDEFLPGAPIFAHSYDYPVVSGIGVCGKGPWLKPSLEFCGWTDPVSGGVIISHMMLAFALMLDDLAFDAKNNFVHVKTLGTIGADRWANELHPNPDGFKMIGQKFVDALRLKFTGRL